jgi:thimet oligopeptidase
MATFVVVSAAPGAVGAQTRPAAAELAWHLSPADVAGRCRTAVRQARSTIGALLARPLPNQSFGNTLRPVEDAYGTFGNTTGGLAFLMYVSPDKTVRDSSAACNQAIANFAVELFADPRLYRAAERARRERLTAIDRMLATRYLENARHGGGALDSAARARATALLQRVSDVAREYTIALGADSSRITISETEAAGLTEQFRKGLARSGDGYVVPVNESTRSAFLDNDASSPARRRYYMAYNIRGGIANVERVRTVVALRDTLAHLFGFPSWAAYQLDLKVAKTPERVLGFLRGVDAALLPKAREEIERLEPLAQRDSLGHPIAVWDVGYYTEQLRRARYALDAEEVRQYFPVEHVVRSVMDVYQEVLGLAFTEVTPADVWAPGVRQYDVRDAASGKAIGTAYLDLFPRADKYAHVADFGLRYSRSLPGGVRERPVTAIVGNWPAPTGGAPSLLSHADVVSFFHEFGHAVASLADESPYIATGTGALRHDFVEALSQMLENWMWRPEVLKRVSRHVTTGRTLPDSLISRMLALKHLRDGGSGTFQALLATYDMTLHSSGADVDPTALWMKMYGELTPLPEVEGVLRAASFGHLMSGYDAGYYGYLWSKVYAQDLFTRFEREGAMNRTLGRSYRRQILAPAATVEPDALMRRFLGRPANNDAFLREMGIAETTSHR